MESHQTGQMEQLVEVKTGGLEVLHQPGTSSANRHACFKGMVTLAIVMGLVLVTLVAVVILHYFILRPSCNQVAPPLSHAIVTCPLKKRDGQGTYDIFTANKTGNYLIYGWVKLQSITEDKIVLLQKESIDLGGKERSIKEQSGNKTEIFFFNKVLLVKNFRIILKFTFDYTDERDGQGTYDIFTANKTGNYLIYGWVKLQSITEEKIVLLQKESIDLGGKERSIKEQSGNKTEIFFFNKVLLVKNFRIILKFTFDYTDGLFHVHEL